MADDNDTPTKTIAFDCFLCQKSTVSIKFRLDGKKILSSGFRSKFLDLVGLENAFQYDFISDDSTICRNCFSSVFRFYEFQSTARDALSLAIQNQKRKKRMAHFSPESVQEVTIPVTTPDENQNKETPSDHAYAVTKKQNTSTRRSLFPNGNTDDAQKEVQEFGLDRSSLMKELTDPKEMFFDELLRDMKLKTEDLTKKNSPSILLQGKSMLDLSKWSDFCSDIIEEIDKRAPNLLDVFYTICKPVNRKSDPVKMRGCIAAAYSILMYHKDPELSAFQRMITAICIRGRAEDMTLTRLNQVGVTMSTSTKIRLLDECGKSDKLELIKELKRRPLLKITGDNLDIFIRSSSQSINSPNTDLHLFASNAVSTRVCTMDMDNTPPVHTNEMPINILLLDAVSHNKLMLSYRHIISHTLVEHCKELEWMKKIVPTHLPHPYKREMSLKSCIFQLPIMFKNEAKYEECVDIMDMYESIIEDLYTKAHGNTDHLDKYGCLLGGDQLTRVRMEGAKDLRALSTTKKARLEHMEPIVCELWHLKADFLEKLYKTFYRCDSAAQLGTLAYYRVLLRKTGVNGKVKSNYQAHADFLVLVFKELMATFAKEVIDTYPELIPGNIKQTSCETKREVAECILSKILDKMNKAHDESDDQVMNYSCQLLQWGVHFLSFEDTAREGDITRIIPNLKKAIPFFISHSKLSKYLVECVNYILQYEFASPLNKMRILEGSFINRRGGVGRNVEADLIQEHSVRHQKELIRGLGANKSEAAIKRITNASNLLSSIISNFDESLKVPQKGTHHTPSFNQDDVKIIRQAIEGVKPFRYTKGRTCRSFFFPSTKFEIQKATILPIITKIKERIERGLMLVETDADDEVDGIPTAD